MRRAAVHDVRPTRSRYFARAAFRPGLALIALAAVALPSRIAYPSESSRAFMQPHPAVAAPRPGASGQMGHPIEQDAPVIVRETRIPASRRTNPLVARSATVAYEARTAVAERIAPPDELARTLAPQAPMAPAESPGRRAEHAAIAEPERRHDPFIGPWTAPNGLFKAGQHLYRSRFAGQEHDAAAAACRYFERDDSDCITVLTAAR